MVYYEWQDPGAWGDEGFPPKDSLETQLRDEIDALSALNSEMLEALKKVVAQWDNTDSEEDWANTRLMIDAAIAKAEGNEAPSV